MIFLEGGRVVDPATRVDGVRTVILDGGRIKEVREQAVSSGERSAHEVVDCRGLLVLPHYDGEDLGARWDEADERYTIALPPATPPYRPPAIGVSRA